jgi:hypothetical protein
MEIFFLFLRRCYGSTVKWRRQLRKMQRVDALRPLMSRGGKARGVEVGIQSRRTVTSLRFEADDSVMG